MKEDSNVGNEIRRIAVGLMALSMRLDTYAMQRGLTMDSAHQKDPDPKNWRTINGSKVHLTEGKIDGGAGGKFSGKEWTGKTKHEFTQKEKPKNKESASTNEATIEKPQQSQNGSKYPDSVKPMKYSEAEYDAFEEKNQLPILKGTPKQISWARLIRKDLEQDLFDNFYYPYEGYIYDHILDQDDAAFWIDVKTGKIDLFGKYANDLIKKITKR